MWKLFALLSALFAALTAVLAKIGVKDIDSDLATAIRTGVVLLITWGVAILGGHLRDIHLLNTRSVIFLVLSGIATGLSWLCYFKAIQMGDVSKVAPIDKLSVVLVIVLSAVFLHEPLDWKTIAGGILIASGSIILAS